MNASIFCECAVGGPNTLTEREHPCLGELEGRGAQRIKKKKGNPWVEPKQK